MRPTIYDYEKLFPKIKEMFERGETMRYIYKTLNISQPSFENFIKNKCKVKVKRTIELKNIS